MYTHTHTHTHTHYRLTSLVGAVVDQEGVGAIKEASQIWVRPDAGQFFQHNWLVLICRVRQACVWVRIRSVCMRIRSVCAAKLRHVRGFASGLAWLSSGVATGVCESVCCIS